MCVDERETGGKMNIQEMEIMKVDEFRCVGSTEEKKCRQGGGYTGRRILKILKLLDRRKRNTTEKNLDMQRVVVREEKTRLRWKQLPYTEQLPMEGITFNCYIMAVVGFDHSATLPHL